MRCSISLPSAFDETFDPAHIEAKFLITARVQPQRWPQQHWGLPEPYIFCLVMMTDTHPKWSTEGKKMTTCAMCERNIDHCRGQKSASLNHFFTWLCSSGSIWCAGRGRNQLPNGSSHLLQVMRGMRDVVIFPGGDGFVGGGKRWRIFEGLLMWSLPCWKKT